jgi:hypothetical protein
MRTARNGFFDHISRKHLAAGVGIVLGPLAILLILGTIFLQPEPIARETVMGCYGATGAPTLVIERDLIRIREPEARTFEYVAEPDKTGYRLSVKPALGLEPVGARQYAFVQQRGTGYFWTLLPADSGTRSRLRKPEDYGGRFEVVARDGVTVTYTRSAAAGSCG